MSAAEQGAVAQLRAACLAPGAAQSELLARILAAGHQGAAARAQKQASGLEEGAPPLVDGAPPPAAPSPEEQLARMPLTSWADYSPTMQAALAAADAMGSDDGRCGCGCDGTAQAEYERQLAAFGVEAAQVLEFWLTSGTTGAPKVLPVTPEVVGELHKMFVLANHLVVTAFPEAAVGLEVRLAYAGAVRTLGNGRSVAVNTAASWRRLAAQRESPGVAPLLQRFASPLMVMVAADMSTCLYLHWLCALARRQDVSMLSDTFTATVALGCHLLWQHRKQLLRDLRRRCVGAAWEQAPPAGLPAPAPHIAGAVGALLRRQAEGCSEEAWQETVDGVEAAFEGGEPGLLTRLFPGLRLVMCVATGAMAKFVPYLSSVAPGVPLLSPGYCATEGVESVATRLVQVVASLPPPATPGRPGAAGGQEPVAAGGAPLDARQLPGGARETYLLLPHVSVYYEFLPDAGGAPCTLEGVAEGQTYELVLSSFCGLRRYRMGDRLRCCGHYGAAPVFEHLGRAGQALNVVGEKFGEDSLVAAVGSAIARALPGGSLAVKDWVVAEELHMGPGSHCGDDAGLVGAGHYLLYLELAAPLPCEQLAAFEAELHRRLGAANAQYAEFVEEGRLGRPELRLLRPGAFLALRAEAVARGAAPAQVKPPVVVPPGGWQQGLLERWRQQIGSG